MKKVILVFILLISFVGFTQEMDKNTFDFWVGEWEVSWKGQDGKETKGTNTIVKILDGKVIQENFQDPSSGFKGTSISVYNPTKKEWHQAWADNQGGYYDFIGDMGKEGPIFKTKMIQQDDKKIIQRMTFKNISDDSFTWDWEGTSDGGITWKLLWRINYKRKLK